MLMWITQVQVQKSAHHNNILKLEEDEELQRCGPPQQQPWPNVHCHPHRYVVPICVVHNVVDVHSTANATSTITLHVHEKLPKIRNMKSF